ncbi:hypothetical protein [Lysobacter sp.]|uniref:hypothetical protein n=1 Tax=Lysobacter sp. TaxID=72226 RepID=UPI002D41E738|nr:hypothetical protein [Lysobacter sp.]HZX78417.1 hypothetical protein [Lysobacter sp.]
MPPKHPRERVRGRTEEAAQACVLFKTPEKKLFAESARRAAFDITAQARRRRTRLASRGRRRGDHIAEKKMSQVVDSAKKRD